MGLLDGTVFLVGPEAFAGLGLVSSSPPRADVGAFAFKVGLLAAAVPPRTPPFFVVGAWAGLTSSSVSCMAASGFAATAFCLALSSKGLTVP